MNLGVLLTVAGLVLAVLIYFARVQRTKMQLIQQKRDSDRQHVLDGYLELRRTNKTSGPDGLQRAGVASLGSDSEIRAVIAEIVRHGEKHPFGSKHELLISINLKAFFVWASEESINFFSKPLEQLIDQFESNE